MRPLWPAPMTTMSKLLLMIVLDPSRRKIPADARIPAHGSTFLIGDDALAGDIAGVVRGKERHNVGDIGRRAEIGRHVSSWTISRSRAGRCSSAASDPVSPGSTALQRTPWRACEVAIERVIWSSCRLRGAVGRLDDVALQREIRSDVDDNSAALALHDPERAAARHHCAARVDCKRSIPHLRLHIGDVAVAPRKIGAERGCVVVENVEAAEFLQRAVEHRFD